MNLASPGTIISQVLVQRWLTCCAQTSLYRLSSEVDNWGRKRTSHLIFLSLDWTSLADAGAVALADALRFNNSLRWLESES